MNRPIKSRVMAASHPWCIGIVQRVLLKAVQLKRVMRAATSVRNFPAIKLNPFPCLKEKRIFSAPCRSGVDSAPRNGSRPKKNSFHVRRADPYFFAAAANAVNAAPFSNHIGALFLIRPGPVNGYINFFCQRFYAFKDHGMIPSLVHRLPSRF
jgi:hypothetical protein